MVGKVVFSWFALFTYEAVQRPVTQGTKADVLVWFAELHSRACKKYSNVQLEVRVTPWGGDAVLSLWKDGANIRVRYEIRTSGDEETFTVQPFKIEKERLSAAGLEGGEE